MNEKPEDTGLFKRRARDVAGQWMVANLWKIVCTISGLVVGIVVGYSAIAVQMSKLQDATASLKQTVGELVTQKEFDAAKERIDKLEDRLDYATKEAGTPPVARHPRKK